MLLLTMLDPANRDLKIFAGTIVFYIGAFRLHSLFASQTGLLHDADLLTLRYSTYCINTSRFVCVFESYYTVSIEPIYGFSFARRVQLYCCRQLRPMLGSSLCIRYLFNSKCNSSLNSLLGLLSS